MDRKKGESMRINRKVLIIAVLFLVINMAVATQYTVTKIGYTYTILHPSDAFIRFIGSDNSTDGIRVLRVAGNNSTNVRVTLHLGDRYSSNMIRTYSAAIGIVNEENFSRNITHINVSSVNYSYMKIWIHGNRSANAENTSNDPSSILMFNNGTIVNSSNTTAWILAAGDTNSSSMCYNVSNRTNSSITTPWDEIAHVRFSNSDINATSNSSDFVWVQITLDIPEKVQKIGEYTGTIWIHLESDVE